MPADPPIYKSGIVFYVYTKDNCMGHFGYMKQLLYNVKAIRKYDTFVRIAIITNCDIPLELAQVVDCVVPIFPADVVNTTEKQWQTRVLYNAYLPFNYSFILDTHIFPCDANATQILDLFEKSDVDISFTNRMNIPNVPTGGAVLSRFSKGSFDFWKETYHWQINRGYYDDQWAMSQVISGTWRKTYKFRWLSNNWFFASHGVSENGMFIGSARCYRLSVVVTGPVRWAHSSEAECKVINGRRNEFIHKPRVYFLNRTCQTTKIGSTVFLSDEEVQKNVFPYKAPKLDWNTSNKPEDSLFW
jgi:hypothetical protein